MIVGFTGTRDGMTAAQLETVRELLAAFSKIDAAHHGDCVGADQEFHEMCAALNIPIHIHPPSDDSKRAFCQGAIAIRQPRDYLSRDQAIVDAATILIAAPQTEQEKRRAGTWTTVRYARDCWKRIFIVLPDGRIAIERNDE